MNAIRPRHIMGVLCLLFISYSLHIYTMEQAAVGHVDPGKAAAGRLVWQQYNCQACHQLFGLGGYLGPDLSNVYSASGKGPVFIAAMVRSGSALMPSYTISDQELEQLFAFLQSVDACGNAHPASYETGSDGMINHTLIR